MKKSSKNNKVLVLLDAHAIIHRAYHALPEFTSASGEPTGALYGLVAMLLKIIRDLKPDYVVACYDLPKPTFRHAVYEAYKAGRPKADPSLVAQIKRSRDVFGGFGIPIHELEGFEADDIIGTITEKLSGEKNLDIIIASGDMDTLQLVRGKEVRVYTLKKGIQDTILYDEKAVRERFGFGPELLPDYKGLAGDPSDNIKGIAGIGVKTATELITQFGTLEELFAQLKKNPTSIKKRGITDRTIMLLTDGREDALFSKVLAKIRTDAPIMFTVPKKTWKESFDSSKAKAILSEFGFRSLMARLLEIFPSPTLLDGVSGNGPASAKETDPEELKDTALALWVLDSHMTSPSLEDMLLYAKTEDFKEAKKKIFDELKRTKVDYIYETIEKPLMPVLGKMEKRGILIDTAYLKLLSVGHHAELETLEKKIWTYAGEEFNINSPKQLGDIIFDKMKLGGHKTKKTPTGGKSTRASELEKLAGKHPIIEALLSYREIQKLVSTYIDTIPEMVDADNRLHTHFIQTGTTTGRLSSQNPNLQNIPTRSVFGREIRRAFLATPGFRILSCDYSQIELRIAAVLSQDPELLRVFRGGEDVHTATGALVFKVEYKDVTAEMRRMAKIINFGILYGMGVNALRENLGGTREEAHKFYENYFLSFKGLASYIETIKGNVRKLGYTETYFGRRRYFPGINSNVPYIRAQEERMAVNAPFQGTSADIIKIAMVQINEAISREKFDGKIFMLLQIHDELLFEVSEDALVDAVPLIRGIMEGVLKADIPFTVDVSLGFNWGSMKRLPLS